MKLFNKSIFYGSLLSILGCFTLCFHFAFAEGKKLFQISPYQPKAGHSYTVKVKTVEIQRFYWKGQKKPFRSFIKKLKQIYSEKVLAVDNSIVTKRKRAYLECSVHLSEILKGRLQTRKMNCPYEGKSVWIEGFHQKKMHFFYRGGTRMNSKESLLLSQEFQAGEAVGSLRSFYPHHPIHLGERWMNKGEAFKSLLPKSASSWGLKEEKMLGSLMKVYEKNGAQMALLSWSFAFPITKVKGFQKTKGNYLFKATRTLRTNGLKRYGKSKSKSQLKVKGWVRIRKKLQPIVWFYQLEHHIHYGK